MRSETTPEIEWLTRRIKLLKNHLQEWKVSVQQEHQAFGVLKTRHKQERVKIRPQGKLASVTHKIQQAQELTYLAMQHSAERERMRSRHQQEHAQLEADINAQQTKLK